MGIADIAMEFYERGGKRLRPRLCKAAFKAAMCSGSPASGSITALCDAVECFHKASLIHDDIQDGDEERYGRPAVWKEHGVAAAIAAGDWLVARGYDLIANSGFPNAIDMMKATIRSHLTLCEGQGDDILGASTSASQPPAADYISVCRRKTGEAFALAATLGALAAGADIDKYRSYGLDFGVLFQMRDDMADGETFSGTADLVDECSRRLKENELSEKLGEWFR